MIDFILDSSSKDKTVYVGVEGQASPEIPFYTIHISSLGRIREDVIFSTSVSIDRFGERIEAQLERTADENIFCIYICSEKEDQYLISFPNYNNLVIKKFFKFVDNEITFLDDSVGEEKKKRQIAINDTPLYADIFDVANYNFQIVVFCAGTYIYNTLSLEGITLIPIEPGLNNLPAVEAIHEYLLTRHDIDVFSNDRGGPWLESQPTFAVHFNHIIASSKENAMGYANRTIGYIRNILAIDRGDRPYPFMTLLLNRDVPSWELYPSAYDFRGNLAAPLFPSSSAEHIEKLRPIIEKNPFARLVLDLYVQTIAEKDRSYKIFRQWSLLEMVAEKYIKGSSVPLKYSDGSVIYREPEKALTTFNNAGKVYELLCSRGTVQIAQGFADGSTIVIEGADGGYNPGGKIISLYSAVAAAYAIRNDVAHKGFYDNVKKINNEKQELSRMFYRGYYGFLDHCVDAIAFSEIYKMNDED